MAAPLSEAMAAAFPDAAHTYLSARQQLQRKVTFEEYLHYASITRAEERAANEAYRRGRAPTTVKSLFLDRFSMSSKGPAPVNDSQQVAGLPRELDEKNPQNAAGSKGSSQISDANYELHTANRALRTAGWGSVFYLITTDILGPSNTP